jgi:hypothetical protein
MAVRTTMADLIARTRLLIGDPNPPATGQTLFFQDQDVQDALDLRRVWVRNAVLRPAPTLVQDGVINYTDYFADMGNWEADTQLQQADFTILSDMTASDYLTGHWTWDITAPGKIPPIFITGKYYDIYGSAADLLEKWAAAWARAYNVTVDGQALQRAQAAQALLAQANVYRRQQLAQVIPLTRSDLNDDASGTNVIVGNTDVMGW